MENGKTKSTLNKLTGQLRMDSSMATKENTFTSMSRNGKTKHPGGTVQFKAMFKSTHKKSTLNLQNSLTSTDKPDRLWKK